MQILNNCLPTNFENWESYSIKKLGHSKFEGGEKRMIKSGDGTNKNLIANYLQQMAPADRRHVLEKTGNFPFYTFSLLLSI